LPHEGGCKKLIERIGQLAGVTAVASILLGVVHQPSSRLVWELQPPD
jgi:hypothetical protein